MDAKGLVATLLLLPLAGCALLERPGATRSGDVDAQLGDAIVAELLRAPDQPTGPDVDAAFHGPSLIAGDIIALAWLNVHTNRSSAKQIDGFTIPEYHAASQRPNLALWTPGPWDMLDF